MSRSTVSRVVFAHGKTFHDGGWFDASAGKPRVQVKAAADAAWETVGELSDYPATTATDPAGLKGGERFACRLAKPVKVFAVRVVGKPACGDNPQQAFSSCAELQAFDGPDEPGHNSNLQIPAYEYDPIETVPCRSAGCLALTQLCVAADAPKDGGWESLFNGKDLSGWVPVHDVTFVVTNGNLRLVNGMGWLRTEKQYADFVLEAEWRALVPEYDSGFFIRAGLDGKPWPKDGWQVNLARSALGGLVKGYKTVVPAETPPMPLNKWVKFRLEVRGRKITLDVDGERAWEFKELDAERGYIGIQAEDKAFDFRNIRIQELPVNEQSSPK